MLRVVTRLINELGSFFFLIRNNSRGRCFVFRFVYRNFFQHLFYSYKSIIYIYTTIQSRITGVFVEFLVADYIFVCVTQCARMDGIIYIYYIILYRCHD